MIMRRHCEGCNRSGVRVPASPSCTIHGAPRSWVVVEKCDACDRFEDDLTAALSRFNVAEWFRCREGGDHALADGQSAKSGVLRRRRSATRGADRKKLVRVNYLPTAATSS